MSDVTRGQWGGYVVKLAAVMLVAALGLAAMWAWVPTLRERTLFMLGVLLGFAAMTVAVQVLGERYAAKEKPSAFLNFVMVLTFAKMMLGVAVALLYALVAKPATLHFLAPFFWTYAVFSVFETWALIRLSLAASPKPTYESRQAL